MERVVCVNGHDKVQKINDFISEVLCKKKVPLGDLRTLRGKVDTFSMMTGRLGASITKQLTEQITQHDDYVGEMLTRELSWIQALIDGKVWRRIQLRKRVGSVTVISDASWSQTEDGVISWLFYFGFHRRRTSFWRGLCTSRFICGSVLRQEHSDCASRNDRTNTTDAVASRVSRVGVLDSTARQLNIPLYDIALPFCFYEIFGKGPMDLIYFLKGILKEDNEV